MVKGEVWARACGQAWGLIPDPLVCTWLVIRVGLVVFAWCLSGIKRIRSMNEGERLQTYNGVGLLERGQVGDRFSGLAAGL